MKNTICKALLALFIALPVFPQSPAELPKVIPPSPTVSNLMVFEEVPVDNYSGQPDISIPLFNKQLNGELSLPAVLKYSTSGVKIEQRAGWTGTGWSLDVGGVVSRTIRGIPDELEASGFYDNKTGLFHLPDFWNWSSISAEVKNTFIWNVNGSNTATYDSEPDLYQFNLPNCLGRFVIVKEGSVFKAKSLSLDQRILIEIDQNTTTKAINGFTITDPNGYIYIFGSDPDAIETMVSEDYTIIKPRDPNAIAAPILTTDLPAANTAWHLVSIKTSNGIELAGFDYVNSQEVFTTPVSRTDNIIMYEPSHAARLESGYNLEKFRPMWTSNITTITTQTKKLSKITFRDQTSYVFALSPANSHPENDGSYLSNIYYKDRLNTTVRPYTFTYAPVANRLWLDAVHCGSGHTYELEYFERADLPNNEHSDAWGYNDGDFRNNPAYGYNYYDYNAFKRGLLTKITYPTGGTKEFFWEPHTFTYEGSTAIGNYDSNPRNATTQTLTHSFSANSNNHNSYSTGSTLVITHEQYLNVNVSGISGVANPNLFEVYIAKTGYVKTVPFNQLPELISLPPGTYTVTVRVNINNVTINSAMLYGTASIMYVQKKTGDNYNYYQMGGGARIQRIDFNDPDNTTPLQTQINYDYNATAEIDGLNHGEEVISSGVADAKMGSMYRDYNVTDRRYMYNNINQLAMTPVDVLYNVKAKGTTMQLTKGNYIGYGKVKVVEGTYLVGTPGFIGNTTYTYTTAKDYPSSGGAFEYPFINNQNLDHKRGLLRTKIVKDKNDVLLEETINDYSYDARSVQTVQAFTLTEDACEWTQFYATYAAYNTASPTDIPNCGYVACFGGTFQNCSNNVAPYIVHYTDIKSTAAELTSTVHRAYFNGTPVETTTAYTYNQDNYQVKSQTQTYTEGTGTITHLTEYEYPFSNSYTPANFTNDGNDAIAEMANMVNLNIVNKPVTVTTSRNSVVTGKVITKYDTFATNQILPKEIETLKGTQAAEDRVVFSKYNDIGNVEQVTHPQGLITSYVWGYYGTLPIAKVDGRFYNDIPNVATLISTSNTGTESTLRSQLNAMRNDASMADYHVTTLTHNPCKGVMTLTDPRGLKQTYEYEANPGWRLKAVKDDAGNLLSEYFYNFRDGL